VNAEDVVMPFGKYKGRTLGDIDDDDVLYLDFLAGCNIKSRRPWEAIGEMCRRFAHEIDSALAARE